MTKQEFLSELERALGKLPHAEVEQALAFYDEAISDRMEDGLSEAEALAGLGPVNEIAAQIAAETPPIPRAIARANTGSRTLNIVLLAVFSPIWIPVVLALAAAALAVYVAIWAVIAALWAVDAVLVLMPFAGLAALASTLGGACRFPACSYSASRSCRAASDSSPLSPSSGPASCSSRQRVPSRAGSRACSCACPVKTTTARRPIE